MQDWFLQHIRITDFAFARWLNEQREQVEGVAEDLHLWEALRLAEISNNEIDDFAVVRPDGLALR